MECVQSHHVGGTWGLAFTRCCFTSRLYYCTINNILCKHPLYCRAIYCTILPLIAHTPPSFEVFLRCSCSAEVCFYVLGVWILNGSRRCLKKQIIGSRSKRAAGDEKFGKLFSRVFVFSAKMSRRRRAAPAANA